jgi:hypothetical protein
MVRRWERKMYDDTPRFWRVFDVWSLGGWKWKRGKYSTVQSVQYSAVDWCAEQADTGSRLAVVKDGTTHDGG